MTTTSSRLSKSNKTDIGFARLRILRRRARIESTSCFLLLAWLLCCVMWFHSAAFASVDSSRLVLMGFAAHPDDEDGATLAYYARFYNAKKPVKAYSVFFTRGEGGQNEIGSALYEELGRIRTRETLDATALLGATPIFLGFNDFGFSKTAKETFAKWGGKDAVLQKVVYLIRKLKPDVVITNHDTITTPPRRQHGHHQAVGISLYEAFEKAADSAYAPEQFALGATPWQIKKMFVRAFRQNFTSEDSLIFIDTQEQDPSGERIQEIAARSLSQHRSQGMDKVAQNAASFFAQPRRYALWRAVMPFPFSNSDLFSGIEPKPFDASVDAEFTERPTLSLFVSPPSIAKKQASESESRKSALPRYSQKVVIAMENTTRKILPVALTVSQSGKVIFRKDYLFSGERKEWLRDTIELSFEKTSAFETITAEQLAFEAKPFGPEATASSLTAARQIVDLKPISARALRGAKIGLIETYDNTLEETLRALGVAVARLDSAELATQDLQPFTTILIDMRAGEYRRDLLAQSKKLFEFIERGGHIVAFYNKPQDWNPKRQLLAPYPIELTSERVVEEDAQVSVLNPKHRFFNLPNKIEPSDWKDWIQERNLYLPIDDTGKTSAKYERLLAMSDEGESQPPTSLLTANFGKGSYTYVSLALYRQLKVLHNGALKLFANLISQPRAK